MKAMVLTRFGGPDGFCCAEVPEPAIAPDQMLVRVAACGVCGHDLISRRGHFPKTHLPAIIGHEIAGTVVSAGGLVTNFQPGDRVALIQRLPCGFCDLCRGGRENLCRAGTGFYGEEISGGYGQYVVATPRNAVALPEEVPLSTGAILSCAIGTGYRALNRARLRLGDTVVVTGASGGVGMHTLQLARAMGLRVIAISSSEKKADRLRAAGASMVITAPDYVFHNHVRELTGGRGADAVIEITGCETFESSVRSLNVAGRVVLVGNTKFSSAPLNPAFAILKEIEILGSGHATVSDLKQVVELVRNGIIKPVIGAELPLEEASRAHEMMESRAIVGRAVLVHEKPA